MPVEESSTATAHQTDEFSESQSEPDSALKNTVTTSSHALVPTAQSQRHSPEYVFDGHLKRRFKLDVRWYELWDTFLCRLFHERDGFTVTLEHWIKGAESIVHYIVRLYESIVVCVIEIKPHGRYESSRHRVQAHQQLKNRLLKYTKDDVKTDVVYGLQCFGDRFMVMKVDTKQRSVTPSLRTHLKHTRFAEVAPKRWWCHKVNKTQDRNQLFRLASEIKLMLRMFKPVEQTQSPLSDSPNSEENSCSGKKSDVGLMPTSDNR